VAGVLASEGDYPRAAGEADVVIVAARDDRAPGVARRLVEDGRIGAGQVLLHTSGVRPAVESLAAARGRAGGIGTLHPLLAVANARGGIDRLAGVAFGVEGEPLAVERAIQLVRLIGALPLRLHGEAMPLYHAGAVLASNAVVALVDLARELLVAAGIPGEQALPALLPLVDSAVRNLGEVGLPGALTGPVVRGDVGSVERHVAALRAGSPRLLEVYRGLGREILRIARARVPDLDPSASEALARLFAPG
jgi:predicted short-subunit dehydrogenase-like oxidoreductase (DUF2520 family)